MTQRELDTLVIHYFKRQNYDEVKKLILSGGNANIAYRQGRTWLIYQSYVRNDMDMVKFLIEQGADPTIKNGYGKDIIHYIFRKSKYMEDKQDIKSFFMDENIQRKIIDNYPQALFSFLHYEVLCDNLKEEYKHLISANELNLL